MTRIIPRTAMMLASLALLPACAPGGTTSTPRPSPLATTVANWQRCARLANRGFTPCPPTPDRMPLPPTTIRNATNGAIPDPTAQQWGHSFQLAQSYYYWAMQHNNREALTSGALADSSQNAVANLFSADLMDLDAARQTGGVLVYQPLAMPATQVVVIPATVKDAMRRQGLRPADYAIAVRFVGPATRSIRLPDGQLKPLGSSDANYVSTALTWGELKSDPDLGIIWYEHGAYGCGGEMQSVCQL